ncbi:coiled-coil domain-containing protein 170-like [Babylonia areolata]|uniref:coiled-coil domain-containing protein 170-like n=1 Tax=Babylonia areolata TaxID=304850 RepID=UPI003FD61340
MSYIRPLETDTLPHLSGEGTNARRIRALEEELAAYRRGNTPRSGILKYGDYDSGSSRRVVTELQDQTRTLREELRKKDALIQHLNSKEPARRFIPAEETLVSRVDSPYHIDHLDRRNDAATYQAKYERVTQQLKDCELELEAKEIKVRELQTLLDANRGNEIRVSEVTHSLQDRVQDLERQLDSYRSAANQGEMTIAGLQRELRDANDKILELESLRRQQMDIHISKATMATEQRLTGLVSQLAGLLDISEDSYDFTASTTIEIIVRRLTDLVQENALLKGKLLTLSETLTNTQLEGKASRDTIMRLVSEMAREQKVATRYTAEVDNLRVERDNAVQSRLELEREVEMMRDRLDASQRMLDTTNAELEMRGGRLASLEHEMRVTSHSVHSSATAFQLFREQLANLLGTAYEHMEPSEESLKEAVRKLAVDTKEHRLKIEEYEARVRSLTEQLDRQVEIQRDLTMRAERFESEAHRLDDKLRCAAGELAAGDVLREGFKFDKEKYLRGLQKLGEAMKMDHISLDLGLDSTLDGLVARAEQLVRMEGGAHAERSTHLYNLQRKVRSLKEQLESKDLHIDLLRKKLTGMEERVHGRVGLEKDMEAEALRVRKLERLAEKYKLQAQEARQEVQNLKAQLMGTSELQLRTAEQRQDVAELARQVEELEEVRRKQAQKISALKQEVASNESHTHEKRLVADNAVQALSSELRTTKNALDSLKYREKQLLDFRGVIARMLGLDVNTLAVPDYEIISRLETLIKAQDSLAFTTVGMAEAMSGSEYGPVISDLEGSDPVIRKSRERSRHRKSNIRTRARSLSPMKRDPRVY